MLEASYAFIVEQRSLAAGETSVGVMAKLDAELDEPLFEETTAEERALARRRKRAQENAVAHQKLAGLL